MKKRALLLPLIAGFAYFTLSSDSTGYPSNRTGSDSVSANTGCGGPGCHASAATSATIVTIIVDSAGVPVTHYTPGVTYRVSLVGSTLASSSLHKFGFQLSTVKAIGYTQAGNFDTLSIPTSSTINNFSGRSVLGHTAPKNDSVVSTFSIYPVSVKWKAPAAGTGSVKLYGVINAVNGDGSNSAADKWNTGSTTITELTNSHVGVASIDNNVSLFTFPNPVVAALTIQLNNTVAGDYNVNVFDMTGKVVATQVINANGGATSSVVNMNNFTAGVYHVVVEKDGVRNTTAVVKQ